MERPVPMCVPVQMGTLGAGNHYAEIQVVEEVFDKAAARKMGIDKVGQVCIMIHSGSRGLGHQVTHVAPFWFTTCLSHTMLMRSCMPRTMLHSAAPLRYYWCVRLSYACITAFMFWTDLAQDVHHVVTNGMACCNDI